jgi:3-methylcrotonyl-CoA carboxylase beta subunit
MGVIESQISTQNEQYKENADAYRLLVSQLQQLKHGATFPESESAIALARKRKKLLTNERIEKLVDPGAAILDLCSLAGADQYDGVPPGAGIRTLISKVSGRTCVIIANNPAVKGGTYFPATVKKHIRAQEIAMENSLPCIYLVDSGGAYLPRQDEVFPDRFHFGRIFYNQAQMSAKGIPQLAVVLGSCTAGGAYVPAMSDEAIMVRDNATIFLGGPPLVKAATGEDVSAEELGGADVHCKISGVADHLADNEEHALLLARQCVASFGDTTALHTLSPSQKTINPRYNPDELYGIVGGDLKRSFSILEVLARLLDDSRFDEFKANYGTTLKCGFGHIGGYKIGVIANDGILFSESAQKAAHFIELCSQRWIPLLFVQNVVGFMVGKQYEHEGIAKHGAKMVTAVASTRVPKFTLTVGGSFGAGNYSMCGRAYDPRFLFTWPNSRISVMGGAQAANVLSQVKRASGARKGKTVDEEKIGLYHQEILEKYEAEGNPIYATSRMWDDGIIDPLDTRKILTLAFASTSYDRSAANEFGVFRM